MRKQWGAIAAIAMLVSTASSARAQTCEINFSGRLGISKEGALYVSFIGAGVVNLCSMATNERTVSKEACGAWYGALLSLRLAKARAQFYFSAADPGNAGVTACTELGDWSTRTPYFLEAL